MSKFESYSSVRPWFMALVLSALAVGCGGGRDPILGTPGLGTPNLGTLTDTTRPRVESTFPATTSPGPTLGAPSNAAITAVFTEAMAPATVTAPGTFTVTCALPCVSPSPTGAVSYDIATRTAFFRPAAALEVGTTYTATITTAATDLASPGNALAGNQALLPNPSNYVWTFTAAAPVVGNVAVPSTFPVAGSTVLCTNGSITATFSPAAGLRMDPATINATNFTVTGPAPASAPVTASSVLLDASTGRIATFTPGAALTAGNTYTAVVKGGATGVKDLAIPGNTMLADFTWTFTVANCVAATAPALNSAATFGIMATSATTSTGPTFINGDVSLDPGTSQGIPPPQINGTIHVNDAVSAQARADLLTAYNSAKTLPPGTTVLGGTDLGASFPTGIPPGTYTSGSTMLVSTPLVLDAGGNANAVWVFQIGSSLTTGANVTLANGAQAKNVFWVPTEDATIGVGTIFHGTILAGRDVTGVTGATINGRILAGAINAGTIALDSVTVNVPAP